MNENKMTWAGFVAVALLALATLILPAASGWAAQAPNANEPAPFTPTTGCAGVEQNGAPQAAISNGLVKAIVYVPDARNGYYRAERFDWAGSVGCLVYKGHSYFGVWFQHYDASINDSITGPVEEFRSGEGLSSVGYAEAKPGELFLKPGIGLLKKIDDAPYRFSTNYPLVDGGKWSAHAGSSSVTFRQDLKSQIGYGYVYKKTLKLDKNQPVLEVIHELKNTGTKTIDTEIYDHDFVMLDGLPTGPGMAVHFPFVPVAEKPLSNGGRIDGQDILFEQELQPHQAVSSYLTGYSGKVSDYDFTIENRNTGVGVEQTSDSPIAQLNFWNIRTAICPEAYIHETIAPGQTAHWTIRYRFFAK